MRPSEFTGACYKRSLGGRAQAGAHAFANSGFVMKKFLFLVAAMSAYVSSQAQVLYNNAVAKGLVDEGLRTSARAEGGSWSQVQVGNMVCGFRGSVNPGA